MILRIESYNDHGYKTLMKREISSSTKNWERILRKMYTYVQRRYNQNQVTELIAVVLEDGYHEVSQAWVVEYMRHYPKTDLPFM